MSMSNELHSLVHFMFDKKLESFDTILIIDH